jgi:hypothetical protein
MDLRAVPVRRRRRAIGAGKTSLARVLAQHAGGEELFERPEDNPFLERFYGRHAALRARDQLTFLFQRVDQLAGVGQFDMFRKLTGRGFPARQGPSVRSASI